MSEPVNAAVAFIDPELLVAVTLAQVQATLLEAECVRIQLGVPRDDASFRDMSAFGQRTSA
jgi:hypothetical protein